MADGSVGVGEEGAEDGAEVQGGGGYFLDEGNIGGYDVSPPVVIRPELRERSFGELDGTILVNYNKVHATAVCLSVFGRSVSSLMSKYFDSSACVELKLLVMLLLAQLLLLF